ncbi:MAG: hypothetical protein AAF203_03075 [Pseudomonadota bacterium]
MKSSQRIVNIQNKSSNVSHLFLVCMVLLFVSQAQADWSFCYNQGTKRVNFLSFKQKRGNLKTQKKQCRSNTYYQQRDKTFQMIEDEMDTTGFPKNLPGKPKIMSNKKGRRILVTQWNSLSKLNTIEVLEPNFKSNQVKRHCQVDNWSDIYEVKWNKKATALKFQVSTGEKNKQGKIIKTWKTCKI